MFFKKFVISINNQGFLCKTDLISSIRHTKSLKRVTLKLNTEMFFFNIVFSSVLFCAFHRESVDLKSSYFESYFGLEVINVW